MATVSGQATTYNLPNYVGELFAASPTETPFLSAIGGLTGGTGLTVKSTEFGWQYDTRRTSSAGNVEVEGANAPAGSNQTRANVTNVTEIHQSTVEVSYSRQGATAQYSGVNSDQTSPITDELQHQIDAELESMAVDIEQSFLNGTYAKPADNTAPRKTRGLLSAVTTNVNANGGIGRELTKAIVDATMVGMFEAGAKLPQDRTVFMVGPSLKVKLSNLYGTAPNSAPQPDRTIGGINVQTIVTDFGSFGVMVNRWMPAGTLAIVDLSVCKPAFLEVPGKGRLFVEPLAKIGASERYQLYGEVGLQYGPEFYHGKIADLL